MKTVFVDTVYWVALLNPRDPWHQAARAATASAGITHLVTTEEVLTEVLDFFSGFGPGIRRATAALVRQVLADPNAKVLTQSHASFEAGLQLYEQRHDKQYSGVDCISMQAMRQEALLEVLTHDHHFEQEGFRVLLRDTGP